ncbi:MmcB family DNA repair protein [Acetivibrio cellulolyticus]|uniref:MmcB family DNA repair protein n=1 Tax=Acetivibrio cellulolyticus TaxID=35830 RepID=UPI0002481AEB|nr:MmcB family DNA repair protein [Acetivibrio cellulolyticus]
MINGIDTLSKLILKQLEEGLKPKDISLSMNVSYDQVKKLSQFNSMCQQVKNIVSEASYKNLRELGIKALVLKDFFDNNEWEGLDEVLGNTNPNTRRSDLKTLYPAYLEKKQEVKRMKERARYKLDELDRRENAIKTEIEDLKDSQKAISDAIKEFKIYNQEEQDFLLEHIGVADAPLEYNDETTENVKVLIKRLDYSWQQKLKKLEVVVFDDENYIWVIPDVDRFVEEYRKRKKFKGRIEYDYNNVPEFVRDSYPKEPFYRNKMIRGLSGPLKEKIKNQKERIKQLEEEKVCIEEEIKQIKKTDVKTFFDRIELTNTLSSKELLEHGRLQQLALKYLFEKNYIAAAEVSYKNYRWDCIGYDNESKIAIIEVKASAEDFLRDSKWQNYQVYCNTFYFLVESHLEYIFTYTFKGRDIKKEIEASGAGILIGHKNRLELKKESIFNRQPGDSSHVIFNIGRTLSKKLIYGY